MSASRPTLTLDYGRWWVTESDETSGQIFYRKSFEDECQAGIHFRKRIALHAGTLQAMLFGWNVEGVGHAPLMDIRPDIRPVFRIETLTRHSRTFSHLEVIVDLSEET